VEWLNYHHLLYFWVVAREGGVTAAAKRLGLTQPTVSGQVRALEEALEEKLFERKGRRLVLTEVGQVVWQYAEEIFALGKELQDTVKGRPTGRPLRLCVGVADVIPKLIAYRLLGPALAQDPPLHLVCREDKTERLLAELSLNDLDLVIADEPLSSATHVRAFNHLLGESTISFFGTPELAKRYRKGFPKNLGGAPMLVPTINTSMRRAMDHFFEQHGIVPRIVAECEDSALMKVFGEQGAGLFAGPTVIEKEIAAHYGVRVVGRTADIRERFYAISVERRITHPVVALITKTAREVLFG
jgi:LysR family transcriptional regulator, transcriptional activator of nhaA